MYLLICFRMIQVCNEINLLSSATYHETSMGPIFINEEEQAELVVSSTLSRTCISLLFPAQRT